MSTIRFLRLCSTGKIKLDQSKRFYMNRNILKLSERGIFEDLFPDKSANEMVKLFEKSYQCVYAGFDPTADSLHVGNLLIIMNLLHWQRAGHQVIALIGGATGLIGDPSHRKAERIEMKAHLIEENLLSIKKNIETIFENHEKYFWKNPDSKLKQIKIVNNIDWYANVNVIEFIRQYGKYFRLGTMLGRSSVQSRLNSETGMSFTEFTYQIFQAYDWLHLFQTYNCRFQIGGSDQMGNIIAGHDLISRITEKTVYGMTLPLITAEGGKKFGKSVGNAVWLSPSKSSCFKLYQFFIRTTDADVEKYLNFFTFLPIGKINEIMLQHVKDPEKRKAQKILAEEVTKLVHGDDGLEIAKKTSESLYGNSLESLAMMSTDDVLEILKGATIIELVSETDLTAYELAMKAKCFKSEKDALRIIPAGGFHINNQKITNVDEMIIPGIHILSNNLSLLRVGKRTYHIVKWI